MSAAPVFGQTADEVLDEIERAIEHHDETMDAYVENLLAHGNIYRELTDDLRAVLSRYRMFSGRRRG